MSDRENATAMIRVQALVKRFGDMAAVDGIDFAVNAGELFGFLGPNGAGKSTTIKMLATLLQPTSGRAEIAGFDVVKQPNEVRQSIGMVFQDPSLDERLTAEENLQFHAMLYDVPPKARGERMEQVLRMVGLIERRRALVRTFSGGMKRRLEAGEARFGASGSERQRRGPGPGPRPAPLPEGALPGRADGRARPADAQRDLGARPAAAGRSRRHGLHDDALPGRG